MDENSSSKGASQNAGVRGKFSGRIGYVLAVAGSAVGLEISGVFPIWRQNTAEEYFCWSI